MMPGVIAWDDARGNCKCENFKDFLVCDLLESDISSIFGIRDIVNRIIVDHNGS